MVQKFNITSNTMPKDFFDIVIDFMAGIATEIISHIATDNS